MDNHNIITIGTALKWRGLFSNEKTYYQDNIILDAGCLFRCKIMQTQNHPPVRIIDENGHFEFINQDIWEVILDMSVYYNRIVGMEYIVGVAMTLAQLSASSRQAGVWYVKNTGLFYKKDADGNIEEADDAYNVIPSETETEQGALPHGRIDKIYRASDGVLFRLVKQENTYVLTDYIDRLSFDKELDTVRTSIQKTQTSVESAHTKISDLKLLPFDGEVPNASSLSSKLPGSIWFSRQDGLFLQVSQDGAVSYSSTYNNGAHASTYYTYVNNNTLYRVRLDNNKASLYTLVDQHDLSLAQNQLTTAINSTKTDIERIGILDFAGSLASLDSLETAADGMWFVEQPGAFYAKSGAETPLMGAPYNVVPTPDEAGLGATVHVRTDLVYRRVSDGRLFHAVATPDSANGPYRMEAFIDAADSRSMLASMDQQSDQKVSGLRESTGIYPFDAWAEDSTGLESGMPVGTIVYVISEKVFYRKISDAEWALAGEEYNNAAGTAPAGNIYRCGSSLAVKSGFSGGLTSLVSAKELDRRLADKTDKSESAELSEKTQELRREIVGLWDETAKIQAKLADLHSTEAENLLKRLGYGEEDIEEYIWAVSHLDLDISLEDLRRSVAAWEAGEDRGQKVAPKWTEEMEAGEETPAGLKASRFNSALYYPHITTGKGFWLGGNSGFGQGAGYAAGLHATAPCQVNISIVNNDCGLGSFTGQISTFSVSSSYRIRCLKLLQSETSIDLSYAFMNQTYVDFRNVHVENATNMSSFAAFLNSSYWGAVTALPAGFSETDKTVNITHALAAHKFVGESIDLADRWFKAEGVFSIPGFGNFRKEVASEFDNCDIDVSKSRDLDCDLKLSYFGYFIATEGKVSRIKAHGVRKIDPSALVAYQDPDIIHRHCGVWEVDCPDAEEIATAYCSGATCATFWNLGASLKSKTIALDRLTSPYQGMWASSGDKFVMGFLDVHEVLRDSFRNAMRSWVSPPEACVLEMSPEQYNSLSEEDIAELSEKGYTVALVRHQIGTSSIQAIFKFE